jgi:hypothetical protein
MRPPRWRAGFCAKHRRRCGHRPLELLSLPREEQGGGRFLVEKFPADAGRRKSEARGRAKSKARRGRVTGLRGRTKLKLITVETRQVLYGLKFILAVYLSAFHIK